MSEHIVSGCRDCPFSQFYDMAGDYSCLAVKDEVTGYKDLPLDEFREPITPNWCPLLKEDITIKISKE